MYKPIFIVFACIVFSIVETNNVSLPIKLSNRQNISEIKLTDIGAFGIKRKARPKVPEHFHTGVDIKRPDKNYYDEPVYSIAEGIVISKRDDGPYSEIIIAHKINSIEFWTLYQHIAGIKVNVGDDVTAQKEIARFMTKEELNKYGWQFDHLHLEIIKEKPVRMRPTKSQPQRCYSAYSLVCYSKEDLKKYYYRPIEFFKKHL